MKKQTLISGRWEQTIIPEITEPTHPKLRGSQPMAVRVLKDKQHVILNAPTGWGKSFVIITLLLHKLLRNPELRGIIAVPQTVIAPGFLGDWMLKIPGTRKLIDWVVQHNLCHEQSDQTVDTLIEFLKGGHRDLGDRILLCTHATLALCYRKLQAQRKLSLIRDVVLWIDEAHHVKNAQIEGRKETVSNTIGSLVKYCMKYDNHVGMATATWLRNDMRHILTEDMEESFARVDIPYDIYFKEMQPVESFEFNVICGGKLKALRSVLEEPKPTIIYLAKRQSLYGRGNKYKEVKQIKRLLTGLKVVDLVQEKGRDKRKAQLDDADVIIALDTCKEGFNWPKMERSIILGERHSVGEMIQMIGRLFRQHPGKKHVEVHQILPTGDKTQDFKDHRNSILTVIFAAMLLEDVFLPIKFKKDPRTLSSRVPNTEAWQSLMRDFLVTAQLGYDESLRLAPGILKRHGITDLAVWDRLWQRAARLTRKQKGLWLDVPFEILKHTNIAEGLLELASGLCGTLTFEELRRAIGRELKHPLEWVIIAEKLAEENGGMLQSVKWLQCNMFCGLITCMRTYPKLFDHIIQEKKKKSLQEWVVIAETLAKENGGMLQNPGWLRKNELGALDTCMQKNPELFEDIPQESLKGKTPTYWIPIAKRMAKRNGGILQYSKWLQQNGLKGLDSCMRKNPELFENIPQENLSGKMPIEWLPIAEKMAKRNGGILQPGCWLRENGLSALDECRRNNPELFENISQENLGGKTPTEWLAVAEKMSKKNGGILQAGHWLRENGLGALDECRRNNPELFKNIPQENLRGKMPTDWVAIAKKMAKRNGGILQSAAWLQQNGLKALDECRRNYPELFKNIPQERKGKRPAEWVAIAKKMAKKNNGILQHISWLKKNGLSALVSCMRYHSKLFEHIPQKRLR